MVAQDQPITKAFGDVTADLLKKLGMNVDFVATDWGTVGARRAQKTPPAQGGWHMFHTWHAGADCINPAAYNALRASYDHFRGALVGVLADELRSVESFRAVAAAVRAGDGALAAERARALLVLGDE